MRCAHFFEPDLILKDPEPENNAKISRIKDTLKSHNSNPIFDLPTDSMRVTDFSSARMRFDVKSADADRLLRRTRSGGPHLQPRTCVWARPKGPRAPHRESGKTSNQIT